MAVEIFIARADGTQKFPIPNAIDVNQKILSPENIKETLPINEWLRAFSKFLDSNPDDDTFRSMMKKNNSAGLWKKRPDELARLDVVVQEWPHRETVGNDIYSVIQNLSTEAHLLNGVNYLSSSKRIGIKKALRTAAFFHDIAKVNDVADIRHPQHSADMVESYFRTMNFTAQEIWLCYFLIKNHDLIGKTVNPKDTTEVSKLVDICHGFPSILQCLGALTIADISSIPGLKRINPNIISDVNQAIKLAYKEISNRNAKRGNPSYNLPNNNIRLFPFY
ncbi:hypothetical protein COT02_00885 [Candidatus Roizmanbacteria bacterium CG07_land_8_20_14_0_80_34_15]|uniref:HD domain-containing protein n=1 Tax=Candidatus Roizmanbacteria bacterium CG07_land_8_20_14_0_80_34_15 TaxID=1974849 RepID=A0A2M6YVA2_9BACT|nr:MAG: hypothetical protein COT02_00885 [Candidatus Roizmanbacteria bacterium CG07_land_8_20_14_0_80_34_15]